MSNYKFIDQHIELNKLPAKFKKLTATRFATILGLNAWSSPFSAWCEMTKTYEEPFTDSKYTIAGKVIEPKICDYLRNRYFMDIKSPTDVYGADYFKKTWGDFFPTVEALGGMWDFLGDDFVVEVKTTKRAEDWKGLDGEIEPPIYYKLQASLYAYLLGFDHVVMTCSFLQEKDYEKPEDFVPSVENTAVVEFDVSEAFPTFKETYVDPALKFWKEHVVTGISPDYDEKKDANILKVLRTATVDTTEEAPKKRATKTADTAKPDKSLADLIAQSEKLHAKTAKNAEKLEKAKAKVAELEGDIKLMDATDKAIKELLSAEIIEGGKRSVATGKTLSYTCTRVSGRAKLTDDSYERMKVDGIYDKYVTETVEVKRKANEKALKEDELYEKYAVKGEDTYSIKIEAVEESES